MLSSTRDAPPLVTLARLDLCWLRHTLLLPYQSSATSDCPETASAGCPPSSPCPALKTSLSRNSPIHFAFTDPDATPADVNVEHAARVTHESLTAAIKVESGCVSVLTLSAISLFHGCQVLSAGVLRLCSRMSLPVICCRTRTRSTGMSTHVVRNPQRDSFTTADSQFARPTDGVVH